MVTENTDLDIINWNAEAIKLRDYAKVRVIKSLDDLKTATDDLSIISNLKKAMETRRQEYVRPLNDQVKTINDKYKDLMAPVIEADTITKQKMIDYCTEQERIRKEQEEINRLREEAAQKEAAMNGGEISEPLNLVEVTPEAPKRTLTDLGTAGMRDNWTFVVLDLHQVPDEYKVIDTAMLNAIAKKHHDSKPVPGVRFYNKPIIAVRAK
jgi:hypothetical protein